MTPEKIAGQEFAHSFRGYDVSDVRGFLARVAGEVRRVEEVLERTRAELAEASERPPPSIEDLTRDQLNQLLGEEAARVLRTADDAARDIRTRAEDNVERMLHEAQAEARDIRIEAERIREGARAEADRLISETEDLVATRLTEADAEALRRREDVVDECRTMLAEAKAARERMLVDLAERRRDSRRELYQLRAGIEQLRESYDELRSMLDRSVTVVDTAVEDARRAAGYAAERFDRDDMADDRAELDRELELDSEPPSPPQGVTSGSAPRVEMVESGPEGREGPQVTDRGSGGAQAVAPNDVEPDGAVPVAEEGDAEVPSGGGGTGGEPASEEAEGVATPEIEATESAGGGAGADGETAESSETPEAGGGIRGEEPVETDGAESGGAGEGTPSAEASDEPTPVGDDVDSGTAAAAVAATDVDSGTAAAAVAATDVDSGTAAAVAATDVDSGTAAAVAATDVDSGTAAAVAATDVDSDTGESTEMAETAETVDRVGPPIFDQDLETGNTPSVGPEAVPTRERSRIIYRREPRPDSTLAGIVNGGTGADGSESPVLEELQAALDRAVAGGEAPTQPEGEGPALDPALVAVESALAAAELDEVFGGPTNFTRDDGAPRPLGGPHAEIDELFARIREARETSVSRAREVMDRSAPAETVSLTAEPAPDSELTPAPSQRDEPGDVAALFRRQEQVASSVEKKISRLLKRGLADQLNEVLDAIRRAPETVDIDDVLPSGSLTDMARGLRPLLIEAVLEGAGRFEGAEENLGRETRGVLDDLVQSVVADMDTSLRSRLESFLGESGRAESGARGLYREWRRERLGPLVRDIVLAAYAAGVVDPLPPGSEVLWVSPEGGCVHPDCADNALATGVRLGSAFPSGHVRSPLAPGCRCLVVAAPG